MFLDALRKQNQPLIGTSLGLLRQHKLTPDTWVIDVDMVEENARRILQTAEKYRVTPYVMSKQFGRNPWLTQQIIALGFSGAVAVDFREARCLANSGVPLRHLGHLVQIPDGEIESALRCRPEVITVFSFDKAHRIAECARRLGIRQRLLLKVCQTGDIVYPGQEGGFQPNELLDVATRITALGGVEIAGVTHFPCVLASPSNGENLTTPNFKTLVNAAETLRAAGFPIEQINAPSANSCDTIPALARGGATHIEPGHAFTGTIPANECGEQPERIAMLYLSEVSHNAGPNSLCFGGGYYRRGRLRNALVFAGDALHETRTLPFKSDNIDYYLGLEGNFAVGSPVIMCFRTQIFVTRSDVALIQGISTGQPTIAGLYDSLGNPIVSRQ
ncbi:YhfX family PLP-dependent enzyme [Serratia marcescens]|uniref:YhfX family PLP-dependent enzyme n=1 Tax=Serratia marcescens TaxID=615 RepID=UPI002FDB418E